MTRIILDEERYIVTVNDVLNDEECNTLIDLAEKTGFGAAPITTARGPVMATGIRNNERLMIDDPQRAHWLFMRLEDHLPALINNWRLTGFNERLRFYRYDQGQRFRWHYDGAFIRNPNERSHVTVIVYLNDGFQGGETRFDRGRGPLTVTPKRGAALLFLHPVRHCGDVIHHGRKYVLRTDAMYVR
ncbi:MAG: 2OG-Fe(II) oxygenase [Myxococcota bacterium]